MLSLISDYDSQSVPPLEKGDLRSIANVHQRSLLQGTPSSLKGNILTLTFIMKDMFTSFYRFMHKVGSCIIYLLMELKYCFVECKDYYRLFVKCI